MDSKRLCTEVARDLVRGTNCPGHGNHRKYDYFIGYWKSPVRVTPEAQVPLTLESKFRMTPIKA